MTRALPPLPLNRDAVRLDMDHALTRISIAAQEIEESSEHVDHKLPEAAEAARRLRKAAKQLRRAMGELAAMSRIG